MVVTVAKSSSALTVTDATNRVLFYAPVTTGSLWIGLGLLLALRRKPRRKTAA